MPIALGLLILALATARGTRLVVEDVIAEPVRQFFITRFGEDHKLTYLVHCTYCASVWIGLVAAAFACTVMPISWWWVMPLALAFSAVAVFAAQMDGE